MSDFRTREGPPGRATPRHDTPDPGTPDRSAMNFNHRGGDESLGGLVKQLADQASHLAQEQANLVKAEVRASVTDMKEAAGAMAGAAVFGLTGLGVLMMGVAFLLAEIMPLWLSTVLVGAVTLALAYAMFAAGQKKLKSSDMSVERSRRTVERAPHAMSGDTNKERTNER